MTINLFDWFFFPSQLIKVFSHWQLSTFPISKTDDWIILQKFCCQLGLFRLKFWSKVFENSTVICFSDWNSDRKSLIIPVICFSDWNSDRKSSKNSTVIRFSDGNSCFFSDVVKILGYLDPEQKNEAQNLCLRCSLRQCPNLTCEKLSYECLFASRFCPNLNWETWKKK